MRKGKLYISFLLGLCLCLFTAFGVACKGENSTGNSSTGRDSSTEEPATSTLESISVSGEREVFIDEFDYADYTITATYSDNSTKTATLTADNLSADDNAKLSTVGTHSLTVSYESVTCSWTVTLKNHEFTGVTFDDVTTTYDGTAKTLAVSGLPTGAQVSYDKATSYTNAGEYTVKATVTLANYNPVELTATLTINKATYDMSAVVFADKTVTYNGQAHSIEATNLPNGVTAQYTGNKQINADEYTITATFTGNSQNYEPIASQTATLTINKATYDMSGVRFENTEATYDGQTHFVTATGLPSGVSVDWENNGKVNADTYTVTAKFTGDSTNYNAIPNQTATLTIHKATITGITFTGAEYTYDGKVKSLAIAGTLPDGVTVSYTGNNQTNAGEHPVTATFSKNANYNDLSDMQATLKIKKATYDMSAVVFKDKSVNYTGEAHSIEATNLPKGVSVRYDGNNKTQAGEYTVTAIFTGDSVNYNAIPNMTATLIISASDLTGVSFHDGEFTYDGTKKSIFITGTLPEGVTVDYTNNEQINANSYTVTATFTCTNGNYTNLPELTATLTIKKAVYDMSAVIFADKTVTYDGQAHSIEATNLPQGVTAEYMGNKQINAGEYEITATFKGDSANYEPIASKTVTLTIEKREVELAFNGETTLKYNGKAQKTITVQATNLVDGDSVELTVSYNGEMIEAGEYIATATLTAHQNYKLTANNTVKVTITRVTHTVTFKQDGFADVTREVLDLADLTDIPEPKTVNGNAFTWDRTDFTSITENITVTANKTLITYKIEYVLQYGKNPTENPKTYTIESASITLKNPESLFGLQFGGWYTSETFLPSTSVTTVGGGQFGDITLYGQFIGYRVEEAIGFEIDYSQGTPTISKTVPYATEDMDLRDCITVSTGCTWQVSGDELGTLIYSRKIVPFATGENVFYLSVFHPDGNHDTLYELHVYRLDMKTYQFVNGVTGKVLEMGEIEETSSVDTAIIQPDNAGYTFVSWMVNGETVTFPYIVTADVTFTAEYTANENTLKFNGNGATCGEISDIIIRTDETRTLPSNRFERSGYVFLGWATEANGEVVYADGANYKMGVKSEYTLYAVWGAMFTVKNGAILDLTEHGKAFSALVIPDTIDGVTITKIAESALANNTQLYSLEIPDSVTFIGKSALSGCTKLNSITLPFVGETPTATSYASVFGYIFGYTTSTSSSLNGDTYQYNDGSQYYYYNVPVSLKTVTVTKVNLPEKAFQRQRSLETVTLGDTITSVSKAAFEECINLKTVNLGKNVQTIELYAFYKCSNLKSIEIPDSVTKIDSYAFYRCINLASVTLGKNITFIGGYVFEDCFALKTIIIGEKTQTIGYRAFCNCNSLTIYCEVASMPSTWYENWNYSNCPIVWNYAGVKGETDDGFVWAQTKANTICITSYTGSATELTIPNKINGHPVTSIDSSAFSDCGSLTKVTMPTIAIDYIPKTNLQTVILTSGERIGSSAFSDCGSLTSVVIGDSVTSIGEDAFYNCDSLTSVVIGDSVTSIGSSAFLDCDSLTSIEIPHSVTSIDSYAFEDCDSLTIYCEAVSEPSGWSSSWNYSNRPVVWGYSNITSDTEYDYVLVGGNAVLTKYKGTAKEIEIPSQIDGRTVVGFNEIFSNSAITSLTIPDSVTSIGSYAFRNCSSLTSVVIPDSVTSIGSYAFSGCSSLTSVEIPDSVTSIGEDAFADCSSLTSVTVDENNKVYASQDGILYNKEKTQFICIPSNLSGAITIPDSVTSIGSYAFSGCSSLTSVAIGDSVTSIGSSAFYGCSSLTSIEIPDSVTSIGNFAFRSCSSLQYNEDNGLYYLGNDNNKYLYLADTKSTAITTATIHKDCKFIGSSAFYQCDNLTEIILPFVGADKSATGYQAVFGYIFGYTTSSSSSTISGATYQYYDSSNSEYYHYYIPTSLRKVTITGGNIGDDAFRKCSSLTSIEIPNSVTSIGNYAFLACSSLTSVEIPDSVTSIGESAFAGCSSLTSIEIPDSVTSIGSWAFYGCSSLTEITLPFVGATKDGTSNTHFGYIFGASDDSYNDNYVPTSLKKVTVTGGNIGSYAFYGCSSLTSVIIPDSVTSIASSAFYGCSSLTSIEIPDSVTSIGNLAFYNCYRLTSVIIPDSVTSIGPAAFYGCNSLQYNEDNGLYYLGNDNNKYLYLADTKSTSITTATIHKDCKFIASSAFSDCSSLTSVVIPDSVTSIGNYAFYNCSSLTSIKYCGTQAQWNAISKGSYWNYATGSYTITYNYQG